MKSNAKWYTSHRSANLHSIMTGKRGAMAEILVAAHHSFNNYTLIKLLWEDSQGKVKSLSLSRILRRQQPATWVLQDRPHSNFPSATSEAFLTTEWKGREAVVTPTHTSSGFAISIPPVKNLHLWGRYKGCPSKAKQPQPERYSPLMHFQRPGRQGKQGTETSRWVTHLRKHNSLIAVFQPP